jgi:hypothetical protein
MCRPLIHAVEHNDRVEVTIQQPDNTQLYINDKVHGFMSDELHCYEPYEFWPFIYRQYPGTSMQDVVLTYCDACRVQRLLADESNYAVPLKRQANSQF